MRFLMMMVSISTVYVSISSEFTYQYIKFMNWMGGLDYRQIFLLSTIWFLALFLAIVMFIINGEYYDKHMRKDLEDL